MNKLIWILVLATLLISSCRNLDQGDESLVGTKSVVVNFGHTNLSESVGNEALVGDVHVVNYHNGYRMKSLHLTDYYLKPSPIKLLCVLGQTSVVYVVANLNLYAGKELTSSDFPAKAEDFEDWLFDLNKTQIETHKTNITTPLFAMSGCSTEGQIIESEEDIELKVKLKRAFTKVDVRIWYNPSVMTKLDLTDAKVSFKQFVREFAPFSLGGGAAYTTNSDPAGELIYESAFTSVEGDDTANKSKRYCFLRNYLPSNNAQSKFSATYLVVEAKWDGVKKYWMTQVSNYLVDAPYQLVRNTHLLLNGELKSEGEETLEITEKITMELELKVKEWDPFPLDDQEIGN